MLGISGVKAEDVRLATFNLPVTNYVSSTDSYTLTSLAFSGMAGFTISAPNSDVTVGYASTDGWVNATYGYCLKLETSDTEAHTIKLTAPSGYKIVGYSLFARSNTSSKNHVLTPAAGGSAITSATGGVWLNVKEILTSETSFTIQTQGGGNILYIPQMTIGIVADTKTIKDKKVIAGSAVEFSNIDDIANGTTPVVLYNTGRGTYQFDNPYNNHIGAYKSGAGQINTATSEFLVNKSGETYTIMNVSSKKYIPVYTADNAVYTTSLSSATLTIVDNDGASYAIKQEGHSFNGKGEGYDYFTYWGTGNTGNSAFKLMQLTEEDINYTIPAAFYNTTAYYRIKVKGRESFGNYFMSASSSDTYMHLTTSAFDYSGTQVWKTYLGSQGVKLYSMGANKYVAFSNSRNTVGSSISAFTTSEQEAYNFIPEAKDGGCYAFLARAPLGNTYLSNNGGVGNGSMGYYQYYDEGGQLEFTRVYRIALYSDNNELLQYIYSDGNITASDLNDYDYSIGGVAKTKSEVVEAINAVTSDDALEIVAAHQRSATISTKAEIDPTKVYTLTVKRGKWMYAAASSNTHKSFFSTAALKTFNQNNQWAFVTVDGGDNYYLYNVGQQCFVMSKMGASNFMDSKFTMRPVTIEELGSDASYPIRLKDGSNYFNENSGNVLISSYGYVDDGNQFSVQAISDVVFDPTDAQAALNAMNSNIPFTTSPAPVGSDFDEATSWYFISMRPGDGNGGYYAYVPDDYNYSSPTNIPLESTSGTKSEDDKYRWCITGSLADGYRLYNKAAGAEKVLVFDGGGKMKDYTGNESASLFYLAEANIQNGNGSPTFVFANSDSRPNRQSNSISTWSNSDTGSEFYFTFDEAYDDNNFYIEYAESVKPFMDAEIAPKYFYLTSAKQKENIWNVPSRYSDGVEHAFYSHDDVTAMRTAVEAYVKKPIATIAVRLKNNDTGKYVSYGTPTWNAAGLICNETYAIAEADLTSVFQIIPATASTYYIYMPTKGLYVGSQTSGNTAFPLVEEASRAEFTLTLSNTPGVISINDAASYVNSNFEGYLHSAGWALPGVVNWQASNASSYWNIEDAGTICLSMINPAGVGDGEDVYMSYANNLGLPLNAPDGVSVWMISAQNASTATMAAVASKDIPAGTGKGVILQAEKGSTIHMNIKTSTTEDLAGDMLIAGDGTTTVTEGNFMLAYKSTDEIGKFYAIGAGGYVVPANKAYLPAYAGVKSLVLSFDEATSIQSIENGQSSLNGEIYNIAGQRVNKATKGLYIINGKKVVIK